MRVFNCHNIFKTYIPVLYIYASSSLLGCHIGTGPISTVSWYWVRILCSWTGFRVGCSLDNARQLNCTQRGQKRKKERRSILFYFIFYWAVDSVDSHKLVLAELFQRHQLSIVNQTSIWKTTRLSISITILWHGLPPLFGSMLKAFLSVFHLISVMCIIKKHR